MKHSPKETVCPQCQKNFIPRWRLNKWQVFCSASCQHAKQISDGASNWKGGRYIANDGRVKVLVDNGRYRMEHQLVAEHILGYRLKSEHVIHIDGNLSNNIPSNLFVYASNSERSKNRMLGIHPRVSNIDPLTYQRPVDRGSDVVVQEMQEKNFQKELPEPISGPWTSARVKWIKIDKTLVKTNGTPRTVSAVKLSEVKP